MVDLQSLAARARRQSEWGRLRTAARIALIVGPITGLVVLLGAPVESCGCAAALFLAAAVLTRWRSRRLGDSITAGLLLGFGPLLVAGSGALLRSVTRHPDAGVACVAACTLVAFMVGVAAALYSLRRDPLGGPKTITAVTASAAFVAALGSSLFGPLAVATIILATATASLSTWCFGRLVS